MKNLIWIAFILFISCSGGEEVPDMENEETSVTDSTKFYPVNDYLHEQINKVTGIPYFLYKITVEGNKRDSSVLNNNSFANLASSFTRINIDSPAIKKYYKEAAFHDATLGMITVTYTSVNPDIPLKSVHILLDEESNEVKHVFLNFNYQNKDSAVIEKLGWNATQHNFYINKIIAYNDGSEKTRQSTVFWQ